MTDKAVYRRSGMRTLYKMIDDRIVIRIVNKEKFSQIDICDNAFVREDCTDGTREITASEFEEAFNLAMERIKNQTI